MSTQAPFFSTTTASYVFGCAEGWDVFTVVRAHVIEEVSKLARVEVVLFRDPALGPIDLGAVVDTSAALRFSTALRWRAFHGLIVEAELLDQTSTALFYRFLLEPHLGRAARRSSSRTFVAKSIVEIVSAVLENKAPGNASGAGGLRAYRDGALSQADDPPVASTGFQEPLALYRWAVDDRLLAARPFVVQYNETDLDFVQRLLEEEGVHWVIEHGLEGSVLTLADRVGSGALMHQDVLVFQAATNVVASAATETVRSLSTARRARARAVRVRTYLPATPLALVEAEVAEDKNASAIAEFVEYPAPEVAASDPPCDRAASVQLERLVCEAAFASGTGNVRSVELLAPFRLTDAAGVRDDAFLYAVRFEWIAVSLPIQGDTALDTLVFAFEHGAPASTQSSGAPSFECRLTTLPVEVPFRPARTTPRPRIAGVQPAMVTAEELLPGTPEINTNSDGSVRLRFPWDQRPIEAGVPSSRWVRVSHHWAGIGYGALHNPRVGHHVLVAFRDGDPDRPVIVGRMYSSQQPVPYDPSERPTVSTLKSNTSPGGDGFNEFRFEDKKGSEEIFLHAQRDLNEVILASHSTTVGGDQSNSVGHDQSNSVGGKRTHDVRGTELVHVHGDQTTLFDSNETHFVGIDRGATIVSNDSLTIGENLSTRVGANEARQVDVDRSTTIGSVDRLEVGADHATYVGNNELLQVGAARETTVGATDNLTVAANRHVAVGGVEEHQAAKFIAAADGASLLLMPGIAVLTNGAGATISLIGGNIVLSASGTIVEVAGGSVGVVSGGTTNLSAGGNINAAAAAIHLNG